jgi:hypothetical protein
VPTLLLTAVVAKQCIPTMASVSIVATFFPPKASVFPVQLIHYTDLQKNIFSVTSNKVGELNSIFYAEFKYVLSFSLSRKVFKRHEL